MPIALVITDLDVGGAERALVALAIGLDRRRWEPSVVCLGSEGKLGEPLRAAGISVTFLDAQRSRPVTAVARLARALRKHRPWLVQSFLFHANIATRLAAQGAGRPWVLGGLRVAERGKRWHRTLDRLTASLSAGSVCVSAGVQRFSQEVGGLNPERLTVIPNGIDPTRLDAAMPVSRGARRSGRSAHLALFIGRIERQKGVTDLLDAAERVIAERPDDWHLVIVGDGPQREALRQRSAESPLLSPRVHWMGRRDDVPSLLKAADVLVLPSLWEGMPNVVLEAMAARRAVVGTRIEGTEDLVIPGETGWLVPPQSPDALAAALQEAAADPDRTRRFGEAGRRRVEESFSQQAVIAAYERLWAGVLGLEFP